MTQLAMFAQTHYELFGGRLGLRAGVRGSVALLNIADLDPNDDDDASTDLTTSDGSVEIGLDFRATEELSLLANFGRGFRAPNIGDLSGLGPRPGNRYQQPADSLGNERALGADAGVRLRHARLTGEAFVFALRHDDRIDVVPTGEMTDSGREIVVSDNVGTTSTYGVEVAASLEARDDLQLSGALTWIRGTKDDKGEGEEPADRIPPLGGSLAARWLPIPALELEASSRLAAAQRRLSARDEEDPRIDPTGTDRFFTFSVGAAYNWPSLRVSARVENLADRQYREHASGIDAPGIDARLLVTWRNTY